MLKPDALYNWLLDQGVEADYMEEDTEIVLACTQCDDDRQRLYITPDEGIWTCFRCGAQGALLDFLKDIVGLDFQEAMEAYRTLVQSDHDDPWEDFTPAPDRPRAEAFTGVELPEEFHLLDERAPSHFLKYLEKRHVSLDLAISSGIGYAISGLYAYRLIVPVITDGEVYSYVARTIFRRCPRCDNKLDACSCKFQIRKVLTPSGGRPRLTLYNLDRVRASRGPRVVVVEGVFDALQLPSDAVALLGSSISPTQTTLLAGLSRGREVIVCLDGDDAGRHGARRVADALTSSLVRVSVAKLPEATDPGSLPRDQLEECLSTAKPYVL